MNLFFFLFICTINPFFSIPFVMCLTNEPTAAQKNGLIENKDKYLKCFILLFFSLIKNIMITIEN